MNKQIKAGANIHAGDGGYSMGTKEDYEAFVKLRNQPTINKPLINKLAEQAKNSVTKDKHQVNAWIQNYNEQFTRLIVLECMRIINNNTVIELDEVSVSHNEACYENILTLEQRFGLDNDTST